MNQNARSDKSILDDIGGFLRKERLAQNKTQETLSKESGISRSALSELENGKNSTLLTLVQVLRTLKLLHLLDAFTIKDQFSPIQLATLQQAERKRAKKSGEDKPGSTSDW